MPDPGSPGEATARLSVEQPVTMPTSDDHLQARGLLHSFDVVATPAGEDTAADGALPILHASPLGASEQAVDIHNIAGRVSEHSERASICTDSDTVLLLGKTGAGKSTTMNWLMGREIVKTLEGPVDADDAGEYDTMDEYYETILTVASDELAGCAIGHSMDSTTEYLQAYPEEATKLAMCDTPGFGETRGTDIEISNSIAIMKLLGVCKSARIAVILSPSPCAALPSASS